MNFMYVFDTRYDNQCYQLKLRSEVSCQRQKRTGSRLCDSCTRSALYIEVSTTIMKSLFIPMCGLMGIEAKYHVAMISVCTLSIRSLKYVIEREQYNTFIIVIRINVHIVNREIYNVARRIELEGIRKGRIIFITNIGRFSIDHQVHLY